MQKNVQDAAAYSQNTKTAKAAVNAGTQSTSNPYLSLTIQLLMKERELLQKEILDAGSQEAKNFRTAVVFSGLLLSGVSILSKGDSQLIQKLVNPPFLISIGFLISSIITSYFISAFRWIEEEIIDISIEKIKKRLTAIRILMMLSRGLLIFSVFFMFIAASNVAGISIGITGVSLIVFPLVISIIIGLLLIRRTNL